MLSKVTTAKHLQLFTAVPQMLYSSLHWKHLENINVVRYTKSKTQEKSAGDLISVCDVQLLGQQIQV